MKGLILVNFLLFFCSCSIQKSLDKGHYNRVIKKIGHHPEKNTVGENFMLAEAYRKSNRIHSSIPFYQKALEQNHESESAYIHLAHALKSHGKYEEVHKLLEEYITIAKDEEIKIKAQKDLESIKKIEELEKNKSFYQVKNLIDLNTPETEYAPVYKNKKLYFTSNRHGGKVYESTGRGFTHLYEVESKGAKVDINTLNELDPIINDFNTNEGSLTVSDDGTLIIFAKGNTGKSHGYNDVHLFFSRFRKGSWSEPKLLRINDRNAWDSCPAFSRDGKTLYFSSNRKGGYGGIDLYAATLNRRGGWVDVRNMGPSINTHGDEMFPYVSKDGSLYFSSTGHPGFGKLDLFKAVREKGKVTITNLGRPMNSISDDFALYEFNETKGFFTSNREGGAGDDDIYTYVNNDPDLKIVNYFLEGVTITKDEEGKEIILPNTKVVVKDSNGNILNEIFTSTDGEFRTRVYPEEDFDLIGEKVNFFTTRKKFSTVGESINKATLKERVTEKIFQTSIEMKPIELEKTIVLQNIYYDLDKADIRPDAAKVLDSLAQIMFDNPEISIELGAHTDVRSDDDYNLDLSQRRANSSVKYIIDKGIEEERITAKGYGETQLIVENAQTEESHQLNRRTEFKVLKYVPKLEEETELIEENNAPSSSTDEDDQSTDTTSDNYDRFFKDAEKD